MTVLGTLGFLLCLWALSFVIGLGLMMGMWAGIHAAVWAFGALHVNVLPTKVIVTTETK